MKLDHRLAVSNPRAPANREVTRDDIGAARNLRISPMHLAILCRYARRTASESGHSHEIQSIIHRIRELNPGVAQVLNDNATAW